MAAESASAQALSVHRVMLPADGYTHIAVSVDDNNNSFFIERTPVIAFEYASTHRPVSMQLVENMNLVPISLFTYSNKFDNLTADEYVQGPCGMIANADTSVRNEEALVALVMNENEGYRRIDPP